MVPQMTTKDPASCTDPLVWGCTGKTPDKLSPGSCWRFANACSTGPLGQNVMRIFSFSGVFLLFLTLTHQAFSQAATVCTTAVNVANFGVDGDLQANTPASANGDDWFLSSQ